MSARDLSHSASGPLPVANLEALLDLLERVEAATGPSTVIDCDVYVALGLWTPPVGSARSNDDRWSRSGVNFYCQHTPVTASLDAALALVERVLPGCRIELIRPGFSDLKAVAELSGPIPRACEMAHTLPLALLATLLRAKLNAETGAETNG